ncbi:hypothetical protein AOC36_08185 [Erysipelothrix larvae]|uniref:Uncharacterized protein n=1 Tax=Erysipelothrix larvae TaxID=1514105 RepID=A0A0X8H0Y2_9FIRM|nr:hypothetical protein [Erysipelothrix larvae]AMC93964.1 hypothetical protein AOC36_08185 [Erysipelothrix larvae]
MKPKQYDKQVTDDTKDLSIKKVMSRIYTIHVEVWSVLVGSVLTLLYLCFFVRFVDWDIQVSINEATRSFTFNPSQLHPIESSFYIAYTKKT